jgi:hypothetical protein
MIRPMYSIVYVNRPGESASAMACIHGCGMNRVSVAGNRMRDDAKITGITPAVLMRSGMCVDWPPYTRRPTTRLAYWTGILRWPSCISTTAAVTATIIRTIATKTNSFISPVVISV